MGVACIYAGDNTNVTIADTNDAGNAAVPIAADASSALDGHAGNASLPGT